MYEDSWCSSIYFFFVICLVQTPEGVFPPPVFTEDIFGDDSRWFSVNKYSSIDQRRRLQTHNNCKCPQIMFGDFHMINWISNVMLIYSNSASFDPTFERKCESIFLINASFDCLSLVLVLQHQPHLMSCPVHCSPKDATHRRTVFSWLKLKQAYIFFFYWAPFLRTDHATSVKWTVWLICQDNGDDYRNMSAFSDPSCSAASSRGSS